MRILFTIAHYFNPTGSGKAGDGREHGAVKDPAPRIAALTACLSALHQLYHRSQCVLDHARKVAHALTPRYPSQIDVVVCTTAGRHLLGQLAVPPSSYSHHATEAEPVLLGFECHAVLRDRLGSYDYYCYLEDDLILHDPWLFQKLAWFTASTGEGRLLQPNRFEAGPHDLVTKAYVDGDLRPQVTARFQNVEEDPQLVAEVFGVRVHFRRTLNPHAGCFFLTAGQMARWVQQPYFLDRDTSFIGPLESAASLGIQRCFQVYKPALENADFLEVQHWGNGYLTMIGGADTPATR
jgi:hypothetical protein